MIRLPQHALVSIPADLKLPGTCQVAVRLSSFPADIAGIVKYYNKRIYHFEIADNNAEISEFLKLIAGYRLRFLHTPEISLIDRMLPLLKNTRPVFLVHPKTKEIKKINYLTSLGFPVHLDVQVPIPDYKASYRVLDFYLHSPLLNVPIQPFHTLLRTIIAGKGYTLWDTEYARLNSHFYIDDHLRLSLAARWAQNERFFGIVNSTKDEIKKSSLYTLLKDYNRILFRKNSPCMTCMHFNVCNGYLKALDDDADCGEWRKLFEFMRKEASRARDLLEQIKESSKISGKHHG